MSDGRVEIDVTAETSEYQKAISNLGKTTEHSLATAIKGSTIGNVLANVISKAGGIISDSLSSAISRVDTLNQFPRVMKNIGFSAEGAQASIDKMSKSIEGLPTTLDGIVGNTQQLAMSIGDLDRATDVAIALNDGFLTFGASSEQVTNAITQLNQMITAGKYDMQSWNSINQSAPGYLDTVAKSMLGAEANAQQLREALNSGKVSSEDFMQAMIDLDQKGGEGITAFAQSAKDATGGIQTSMNNAKNAIAKNVANIIQAINQTGAITGFFDGLKAGINAVGGVLVDFTNKTIGYMQTFAEQSGLMDRLGEAFSNLGVAIEPLLPYIQAFGEFLAYAFGTAVTLAVEIVIALVNVLSGLANIISSVIAWFQGLPEGIQSGLDSASEGVSGFIDGVISFFGGLPGAIAGFLANIIGNIVSWGAEMVSNAISTASNFGSSLINGLASLPGQMLSVGANIISGLVNGILNNAGAVIDALTSAVGGAIEAAKNFLGIHSPSRLAEKAVGFFLPAGVAVGIDKKAGLVVEAMKSAVNGAIEAGKTALSSMSLGSASLGIQTAIQDVNSSSLLNNTQGLNMVVSRIDVLISKATELSAKLDSGMTAEINKREFMRLVRGQ